MLELPAAPLAVVFDSGSLTSYGAQDGGAGASVAEDGSRLNLDGNLWTRAPLGQTYTIAENTRLVATVSLGTTLSEIVAIGFDDDNAPLETGDRSVYQVAGSQTQGNFVELRGGAAGAPGQTITVTIDLSAHAGKQISSLVFIADDDYSGNGIGSVSFSNVQLLNGSTDNAAPVVVGGGFADLTLAEDSLLEIDLPFVDPDGDTLTCTLSAVDAAGNPATGFETLVFADGTLKGAIDAAPGLGAYTLIVTASDGRGGETSASFGIVIETLNDAPLLDPNAALEPYFGAIGQEIDAIDLKLFSDAFSDPDGDILTLAVEGLPAGLSVSPEGVITGTLTSSGDGTITIVATDPSGLRAELELPFFIAAPAIGEVTVIEAEAFTGLLEAAGFYAAGTPGASGDQIIRTNGGQSGSISTNPVQNGLVEGWYTVSITLYDETDGSSIFSLQVGDALLADDLNVDAAGPTAA